MINCPTITTSEGFDGGRRRRSTTTRTNNANNNSYGSLEGSSESSPLQLDGIHGNAKANYATFVYRRHQKQLESMPLWRSILSKPRRWISGTNKKLNGPTTSTSTSTSTSASSSRQEDADHRRSHRNNISIISTPTTSLDFAWIAFYVTIFIAGMLAIYRGNSHNHRGYPESHYNRHHSSESLWDHNIYLPYTAISGTPSPAPTPTIATTNNRAFLIAQLAGPSGLEMLVDISSRPNRAYARQHSMDYVRYSRGGRSQFVIEKLCFDKVILLNTILDQQLRDFQEDPFLSSLFSLPDEMEYDAVALLPPDSIITDLDSNIFDLLPMEKLVAIAGWNDDSDDEIGGYSAENPTMISETDVVFINLRHKYANAVAKLWWDWVESPEVSCGAGNDLTLLIDAISVVMDKDEELVSLIAPLWESRKGFIRSSWDDGKNVIKGITPSTPQSRAHMLLNDLSDARMELQSTADSVCYRYYPRCEVLY